MQILFQEPTFETVERTIDMIMEKDKDFQHEPITNILELLQQELDWPDLSDFQGAIKTYIFIATRVINLHIT